MHTLPQTCHPLTIRASYECAKIPHKLVSALPVSPTKPCTPLTYEATKQARARVLIAAQFSQSILMMRVAMLIVLLFMTEALKYIPAMSPVHHTFVATVCTVMEHPDEPTSERTWNTRTVHFKLLYRPKAGSKAKYNGESRGRFSFGLTSWLCFHHLIGGTHVCLDSTEEGIN